MGDIGAGDRHERLALGDSPNIAARLQGMTEASTVVVSGATHLLVDERFRFERISLLALSSGSSTSSWGR